MTFARGIAALIVVLQVCRSMAASYSSTSLASDYVICEGPPAFVGNQNDTIRIGANSNNGSPSGRNAVLILALPGFAANESFNSATLAFFVAGKSGSPSFNADLWGIGIQTSSAPIVNYLEADSGDALSTKLGDNLLTPSSPGGFWATNSGAALASYIGAFYTNNPGYSGGSYVSLRLNPDADSGTNSIGWSIFGGETTTGAVLTVTTVVGTNPAPPQIASSPTNQTVVAGTNVTFHVAASGQGTLQYQWFYNNALLNDGGRVSGATTSALMINSVPTNDAGSYLAIVTNAGGSVTSAVATLRVLTPFSGSTTNFIVIITDDHRWDSLGVVQREMLPDGRFPWFTNGTPNLDRLAAEGVRFRNAFVTLSLCSPSRAAILTGKYNHRNGIINNSTMFPTNAVTYASKLREAGYVTGMVGKWHMSSQVARPGFDFTASFTGQGNYNSGTAFYVNGVSTPSSGWIDDVSTDYALEFIFTNYARPFALHIGYKSSHSPHTPPDWATNLYSDSVSLSVPNLNVPPPYRTNIANNTETAKRNYHRCLTAMDAGVGRILDWLDKLNVATNTMIVFIGDNGFYLGEHGLGDKRSLYEESWRVPLLVRYPRFPAQAARDELVQNIDIAPTVLDFAGVPIPSEMQGRSWRPLLNGGAVTNWRGSILGEYFFESGFAIPTTVAVRTFTNKLVFWPGHDTWSEMFDLTTDRYEVTNLFNAPAHLPARIALRSEFERLLGETCLAATMTNATLAPGQFSLSITGGIGPLYQLEGTSNFTTWTAVAELKMTSAQTNAVDTNITARKFYRLRWLADD